MTRPELIGFDLNDHQRYPIMHPSIGLSGSGISRVPLRPPSTFGKFSLQFSLRRSSGGEYRAASGFGTTRVICRPGTE